MSGTQTAFLFRLVGRYGSAGCRLADILFCFTQRKASTYKLKSGMILPLKISIKSKMEIIGKSQETNREIFLGFSTQFDKYKKTGCQNASMPLHRYILTA